MLENTDNRDRSLIASPEGHRELSRSVISWQGSGEIHLFLEEAGTVQLLICEGKRAEGTGIRGLCVPSEDHKLTKLQPG